MANLRNRTSKSNTRARRANWRIILPSLAVCPQCHQPKLPHRVCKFCGFYKGKEVGKKIEKK